jgi:hypothetical protein
VTDLEPIGPVVESELRRCRLFWAVDVTRSDGPLAGLRLGDLVSDHGTLGIMLLDAMSSASFVTDDERAAAGILVTEFGGPPTLEGELLGLAAVAGSRP